MDRQEVYEQIVRALEDHFGSGQFERGEFAVAHNSAAGTVVVVDQFAGQAFVMLDVTGAAFSGGETESDPVVVHLPDRRQS